MFISFLEQYNSKTKEKQAFVRGWAQTMLNSMAARERATCSCLSDVKPKAQVDHLLSVSSLKLTTFICIQMVDFFFDILADFVLKT